MDEYEERTRIAHRKLRTAVAIIAAVTLAVPMLANGGGKGGASAQAKGVPTVKVIVK